jgi:hypothetical protein
MIKKEEFNEITESDAVVEPDSAFPFHWVIVPQKNGKDMVLGAGKMDGIVCSKEELFQWVARQFAIEKAMQTGMEKAIQQSKATPQIPQITSKEQVEFIKKAIEEGLELLKDVSGKDDKTAKEFKLWKTKTFKN